jgi:photosystem II stability/assembly factor-like uncharacterized protein
MRTSAQSAFTLRSLILTALLVIAKQGNVVGQTGDGGESWRPENSRGTQTLYGVWGSSPSDIFAVGEGGTILHYDGTRWWPQISSTFETLYAVGGTSATDVYAVGARGTIVHYDGSMWQTARPYLGPEYDLRAVWAASPADVFVVGDYGTILHYDGVGWSPQPSYTNRDLEAVWGRSGKEVYAVGGAATLLRYDGRIWQPQAIENQGHYNLQGVWGSSDQDLYVVGTETVLVSSGQEENLTSSTILRSAVLHYNGNSWRPAPGEVQRLSPILAVCVISPSDVYLVAGPNATLAYFDGTSWNMTGINIPLPMTFTLNALWGTSTGEIVGVGTRGTIVRRLPQR